MSASNDSVSSLIEPVIDHSLSVAQARALPGDVAHGLLAALRRVRNALDEVGGAGMVSILDGAIRDRLIIRNLRNRRAGERIETSTLPVPGATAHLAETILVDAAETCLLYAAEDNEISGVLLIVFVLVDRLIETLQATPDLNRLHKWLMDGDEAAARAVNDNHVAHLASVH